MGQRLSGIYILGLPAPYPENVARWVTNELINKPEQGTTFDIPQRHAVIKAPAGKAAFVRAEGERRHHVRMGLPDQVQDVACLTPHPHFAPLAGCGPVLPATADGD